MHTQQPPRASGSTHDVYLLDLINGISGALDYVSSTVTGHHRRVGVGAAAIGGAMGLNQRDTTDLLVAALLHDIGAFSLDLRLDGLDFDSDHTAHAGAGYRLLRLHPMLTRTAAIILHHHTGWNRLPPMEDTAVPLLANIINLMDRVDILSHVGTRILGRERIRNSIRPLSGSFFAPAAVEAFLDLSAESAFWERISDTWAHVRDGVESPIVEDVIPENQLLHFSRFFAYIIDFRSRHTATHSQGVAETAVHLAGLAGMSVQDQNKLRLAGNLHDIGKLAVPVVILDKPSELDNAEYETVRNHAAACETILRAVPGLEDITDWACQHHERIDGSGYPHGLKGSQISLGSRIVAVADVFTAITEDRPYRAGMTPAQTHAVLKDMAQSGILDPDLVALLLDHHAATTAICGQAQRQALAEFTRFRTW